MLDRLDLVDAARNRRYLLEKTQHLIGGFGKGVGEPPGKLSIPFVCSGTLTGQRSSALVFRPGIAGI